MAREAEVASPVAAPRFPCFFFLTTEGARGAKFIQLSNSVQREVQNPEPENWKEEKLQDTRNAYEPRQNNKLEVQHLNEEPVELHCVLCHLFLWKYGILKAANWWHA